MGRVFRLVRRLAERVRYEFTHAIGRLTRKYYYEDYIRVYPGGIEYTRDGRKLPASEDQRRNFLNHVKFYDFARQFVNGKSVVDAGCGSGYGCDIFDKAEASEVRGADVSKSAIKFAKQEFPHLDFSVQEITKMNDYADDSADVAVCCEVLEHVKEYGKERAAVRELHRITKPGGLVVCGTPNSELLGAHGFTWQEIRQLFSDEFKQFIIFENSLIPFDDGWRREWEQRSSRGETGEIVTQQIAAEETAFLGGNDPQFKKGKRAGTFRLGSVKIDTSLLHNTHSWVIVAIS